MVQENQLSDQEYNELAELEKEIFNTKDCKLNINDSDDINDSTTIDSDESNNIIESFDNSKFISKEELNNSKTKEIFPTGYMYFDYLAKIEKKHHKDYILFAPSWSYSKNNCLDKKISPSYRFSG